MRCRIGRHFLLSSGSDLGVPLGPEWLPVQRVSGFGDEDPVHAEATGNARRGVVDLDGLKGTDRSLDLIRGPGEQRADLAAGELPPAGKLDLFARRDELRRAVDLVAVQHVGQTGKLLDREPPGAPLHLGNGIAPPGEAALAHTPCHVLLRQAADDPVPDRGRLGAERA